MAKVLRSSRNLRLIQFAVFTLDCLESSEDWDADMLDVIANYAKSENLAEENEDGMFTVKAL